MLALSAVGVLSKVVNQNIALTQFSRDSWKYLTKFAIDIGRGEYHFRVRFNKKIDKSDPQHIDVTFLIYLDDVWETVYETPDCFEKSKLARVQAPVKIPANGDWSEPIKGGLN